MKWDRLPNHIQDQLALAALSQCLSSAKHAASILKHFGAKRTDLAGVYDVVGEYFLALAKKVKEKP